MLTGHYASGFVGKAADRRIPLWALCIGAQLVDVANMVLVLTGTERASFDYSLPSNPLVVEYVPYTHSLVAAVGWAALGAAVTWIWLRSTRSALVMGAVVVSHWFLDLLVHRRDLTLAGGVHKLGLGLWNYPLLGFVVELATLAASVVLCLAVTRPSPRQRNAILVVSGALVAIQVYAFFGPPPPNTHTLAISVLVMFMISTLLAVRAK